MGWHPRRVSTDQGLAMGQVRQGRLQLDVNKPLMAGYRCMQAHAARSSTPRTQVQQLGAAARQQPCHECSVPSSPANNMGKWRSAGGHAAGPDQPSRQASTHASMKARSALMTAPGAGGLLVSWLPSLALLVLSSEDTACSWARAALMMSASADRRSMRVCRCRLCTALPGWWTGSEQGELRLWACSVTAAPRHGQAWLWSVSVRSQRPTTPHGTASASPSESTSAPASLAMAVAAQHPQPQPQACMAGPLHAGVQITGLA